MKILTQKDTDVIKRKLKNIENLKQVINLLYKPIKEQTKNDKIQIKKIIKEKQKADNYIQKYAVKTIEENIKIIENIITN